MAPTIAPTTPIDAGASPEPDSVDQPARPAPFSPRRFAITASDRYLGVFKAFIQRGWEPVKLFCARVDGRMHRTEAVLGLAEERKIDIQLSPMNDASLDGLRDLGCDLLVVASYQWRIGDWASRIPKAINFHPSPLPVGRGPYPLPRAILDGHVSWGASCHKVSKHFDRGDILAQRVFELSSDETHESLDLKTQRAMSRLAHEVASGVDTLWECARPQGEGSYYPFWTENERTLDFSQPPERINTMLRAYGRYECLARVKNNLLHVIQAQAWREPHALPPGELDHVDGERLVISCTGGFVALLEWNLLAPGKARGTAPR